MAGSMVEIGGYTVSWLLPKARHVVSHHTKHHISTWNYRTQNPALQLVKFWVMI